jgi:hypothetical protein
MAISIIMVLQSPYCEHLKMAMKKWIMKQYWRVSTIRAILGLLLGMLVLGAFYYRLVPFLSDLGIFGAIILAGIFFLIFLGVGYVYDAKARLWNEQAQVGVEKNPYMFVPYFRFFMAEYPLFYALIYTMKKVLHAYGLDSSNVEDLSLYLEGYFNRRPWKTEDLFTSEANAKLFIDKHPFLESRYKKESSISISSRIKKGFQLQVWRLTWVQSFTGLAQDVLVFGTLYIGLVFPGIPEGSFNLFLQGLLLISIPL